MEVARIAARTWNEEILFSVLLELGFGCNLRCFYCYNDTTSGGEALALADYDRLLEELAEMQVMNLTLSGGEPLVHRDFFAIGRKARGLGFVVRIKSNGHALTAKAAERLRAEVDPFVVELSLHGSTRATHERQTRVPGSFPRLLANLESAVGAGLRIELNSTLTGWNESEVEAMYALADRLGVKLSIGAVLTPRDNGDRAPLEILPTVEGLRRLQGAWSARSGQVAAPEVCSATPAVTKICGAGSAGLTIDPFGEVFPCVQWRRSLGNIRRSSIRGIWQGSPELAEVRRLSREAKTRMDALEAAGQGSFHCMGLAEEMTGDPLETDPVSRRNAEVMRSLAAEEGLADGG